MDNLNPHRAGAGPARDHRPGAAAPGSRRGRTARTGAGALVGGGRVGPKARGNEKGGQHPCTPWGADQSNDADVVWGMEYMKWPVGRNGAGAGLSLKCELAPAGSGWELNRTFVAHWIVGGCNGEDEVGGWQNT